MSTYERKVEGWGEGGGWCPDQHVASSWQRFEGIVGWEQQAHANVLGSWSECNATIYMTGLGVMEVLFGITVASGKL